MSVKNSFFVLFLVLSLPAFSQTEEGKNMGKINLSALALKGLNIQYERQIGPRVTVAIGYSAIPNATLPFKGYLNKQINNPGVNINDFRLGTSIITPEIRYYYGKEGAFHGFYIAPYARFAGYNISGPVTYTTSTKVNRTAVFDGKINLFSAGMMLGSNFHLTKKLYLDWWIAGGSYGTAKGNVHATTSLNLDEQAGLKQQLEKVRVPFTTLESEVNSNGATVTSVGNMIGVRGFGINLGFRF